MKTKFIGLSAPVSVSHQLLMLCIAAEVDAFDAAQLHATTDYYGALSWCSIIIVSIKIVFAAVILINISGKLSLGHLVYLLPCRR